MKSFKLRNCAECSNEYSPTGPAAKYCPSCSAIKQQEAVTRMIRKRAKMPGVGKGGYPHRGTAHPNFKHGRFTYETTRGEIKAEQGACSRCECDLREATHYQWVIHHKDHNQYNYHPENLELLCKRCHQIEHECHRAFEGATTIPEGSTAKRLEAPDTPKG